MYISSALTFSHFISLSPQFYENLKIHYNQGAYLEVILVGHGIQPLVSVSPDTDILDWGHVMVDDSVTRTLQLTNTSQLTVKYNVILERLRPSSITQGT